VHELETNWSRAKKIQVENCPWGEKKKDLLVVRQWKKKVGQTKRDSFTTSNTITCDSGKENWHRKKQPMHSTTLRGKEKVGGSGKEKKG